MYLTQLKYFLVVSQMEHMSKAAEKLHITQPALSKIIHRLEDDLETKLFEREGKSIRLNRYGHIVREHVERILAELSNMENHLNLVKEGVAGTVHIGEAIPLQVVPDIHECMKAFIAEYPQVQFQIHKINIHHVKDALERLESDIAISNFNCDAKDIHWEPIFSEHLGVVLPAIHELASKDSIWLGELQNEYFLCNKMNSSYYELVYSVCTQSGFTPKIYCKGDFVPSITDLIKENYGVYLLSANQFTMMMDTVKDKEDFCFVPINDTSCVNTIYTGILDKHRSSSSKACSEASIAFNSFLTEWIKS